MNVVLALAVLSFASQFARTANASYIYDPTDFAVEVVAHANLTATGLYDDPASILGRPTLRFNNSFTTTPDYHRAKLIEAPFNTGTSGEKLITTLNAGQSITVRMGRRVYDDPNNPFGVDLNVFGNTFFAPSGGGGFPSDTTNLNTTTLSGGAFAENVRVSVSPNNVDWYTYTGITGDGLFPTNSFRWDRATAAWTNDELDPTRPIDPALHSLSLSGMTAAAVLDLYDGAAGGTGFDLAASGFAWIEYVRVDGIAGFSGGEIDAIAAVRPIPEPASLLLLTVGLGLLRRTRSIAN